jgi:hypothetical protein
MKVILLIGFSIALLNFHLFSQERVNKQLPIISSKVSSQLLNAKGWILNPEGQWISRNNRIPAFIDNQFKQLIDYQNTGLGIDNFVSFQFREIKIADSTYFILIKKYKDGYFKYPNLHEGWTAYLSLDYYVINKYELNKLNSVKNDSINLIKLNVLYSNSLTWIDNETYITDVKKEVSKEIETRKNEENPNLLIFHLFPKKDKNVFQFQIYSCYKNYNIIRGIVSEYKIENKSKDSQDKEKQIYLTDELFNHCYFETDFISFEKFIKFTK